MKFENTSIYAVEHIPELVKMSENIFRDIHRTNVKVFLTDGRRGGKENTPYDFIHVGACTKLIFIKLNI
jgi:protein-L-isoaspartate O-methyltransferase